MITKKEIREFLKNDYQYKNINEKDLNKLATFFYKLQGLHIEVKERQQLKGGRTIYGGWPYSLEVTVYKIKKDGFYFLGYGITTGDYSSHKGINQAAFDVIARYYNIDSKYYIYNYSLLKKCNITYKHYSLGYNGRYEKKPFEWK